MSGAATELIVVRHGQTDLNREPRFQGQIDAPLNALGQLQAERLSERLAGERVDAIVASDLTRTRQTAEPSSQRLGLAARLTALLREQSFGVLEGLSFSEAQARHPRAWDGWLAHDPDVAPPGGESTRNFHARVLAAVRALAQANAGRSIALVTHGGVLDMLWRTAQGLPLHGVRTCVIPNAGINRLRVRGELIEVIAWGDDAHVADLLD